MKVLLKKDVDNLGYAGEIFSVSPGYGRNFLIPQGLAVPATEGTLRQAKGWMEQAAARREQMRQEFAALVERINGTQLEFEAKAGESGKLYGSITTAEIADRLSEELGIEIDRRKINAKPLRQLGTHAVEVRIDSEFQAKVEVTIRPDAEGVISEEPPQEVVEEETAEMEAEAEPVAEAEAEVEQEPVVEASAEA